MKVVLIGRRILLPLRYSVTNYLCPYDPKFVHTIPSVLTIPSPSIRFRVRPYDSKSVYTITSPSIRFWVCPNDSESVFTIPCPAVHSQVPPYDPKSLLMIPSPSVRPRVCPFDPEWCWVRPFAPLYLVEPVYTLVSPSIHRRRAVAGVRPSAALQCTTEPSCTTKRAIWRA